MRWNFCGLADAAVLFSAYSEVYNEWISTQN